MIDKIYYGVILSVLTGLVIWSIKSFVGKAIESMTLELRHVKDGVIEVKNEVKENLVEARKAITHSTNDLKEHFNSTCNERTEACQKLMYNRINRLEEHGHVGLKGEDAKITKG